MYNVYNICIYISIIYIIINIISIIYSMYIIFYIYIYYIPTSSSGALSRGRNPGAIPPEFWKAGVEATNFQFSQIDSA